MAYKEIYKKWLEAAQGEEIQQELMSIKDDEAQIKERFFSDLPFGIGGIARHHWRRHRADEPVYCRARHAGFIGTY